MIRPVWGSATRPFSAVAAHGGDRTAESTRVAPAGPVRPTRNGRVLRVVYMAVTLAMIAANIALIVALGHATARYPVPSPVYQASPIAPSMAIFGGGEAVRQ